MSKVLIISDLHFGHANICKFRPEFTTPSEHDEVILSNILSVLNKRDTLWLLGDCFFTSGCIYHLREISNACQNVNWIIGNHDTDKPERQALVKKAIGEGLVHKVGSLFKTSKFWLSHAPIHPAELRGKKNIHGHVHRQTIRDDNYLNVCCENVNYYPVVLQQLELMPEKVLVEYGNAVS